jgi:hypothetical protein
MTLRPPGWAEPFSYLYPWKPRISQHPPPKSLCQDPREFTARTPHLPPVTIGGSEARNGPLTGSVWGSRSSCPVPMETDSSSPPPPNPPPPTRQTAVPPRVLRACPAPLPERSAHVPAGCGEEQQCHLVADAGTAGLARSAVRPAQPLPARASSQALSLCSATFATASRCP